MTDDELAQIEARANAATRGPWFQILSPWGNEWVNARSEDPHGGAIVCDCQAQSESSDDNQNAFADAAFIAHAREDVPKLVAEVRRFTGLARRPFLTEPGSFVCKCRDVHGAMSGHCEKCGMHSRVYHGVHISRNAQYAHGLSILTYYFNSCT